MAFAQRSLIFFALLNTSLACQAERGPNLEPATPAVPRAFHSHDIVMLGDNHGNKQEFEWLRSLISTPEFADSVDDIVMEFGNSLYQQSVDRYVDGQDIPLEAVQGAWLNTVGAIGAPSPVIASLCKLVRDVNITRKGKHQLRVVCGDPPIDWAKVKEAKDILPYLEDRDQSYARAVKTNVLASHRRALLIMGAFHFLRQPGKDFDIEQQLREAGGHPYLILSGTDTTGGPGEDSRFASWPSPVVVSLTNDWVGDLPAMPVITGDQGSPFPDFKLKDAADALLYLGLRAALSSIEQSPTELQGTAYGKEIARRQALQMETIQIIEKEHDKKLSKGTPK